LTPLAASRWRDLALATQLTRHRRPPRNTAGKDATTDGSAIVSHNDDAGGGTQVSQSVSQPTLVADDTATCRPLPRSDIDTLALSAMPPHHASPCTRPHNQPCVRLGTPLTAGHPPGARPCRRSRVWQPPSGRPNVRYPWRSCAPRLAQSMPHVTTSRRTTPNHTTPNHTTLNHATPHHTSRHHTTQRFSIPAYRERLARSGLRAGGRPGACRTGWIRAAGPSHIRLLG